jgi:hypothetical protein
MRSTRSASAWTARVSRRLGCRFFLRSSVLSGVSRESFLPFYALRVPADARHPCHALYALGYYGLIPTKPAVLGAANGMQKTLLRNVS